MIPTIACMIAFVGAAGPAESPTTGSHSASQTVADILRETAGSEIAWVPAALANSTFDRSDLATWINVPTEGFLTLTLTGGQIREALERSVGLYPTPNVGFLQLSGCEVTFRKSAPAGTRIASVSVGTRALNDDKSYTVAMPSLLFQGFLGYSGIWERAKPSKTFEGITLMSLLKSKAAQDLAPRWTATG